MLANSRHWRRARANAALLLRGVLDLAAVMAESRHLRHPKGKRVPISSPSSEVSSPSLGSPCHPLRQLAGIATAPWLPGRPGPPAWQDQLPILVPLGARRPEYQSLKLERKQRRQVSCRCIGHNPVSPRIPVLCTLLSKRRLRRLATRSPVHTGSSYDGTGRYSRSKLKTRRERSLIVVHRLHSVQTQDHVTGSHPGRIVEFPLREFPLQLARERPQPENSENYETSEICITRFRLPPKSFSRE